MRAYVGYSIFSGDFGPIQRRLDGAYGAAGLNLLVPTEFSAVNYTLNRTVSDIREKGEILRYGGSYIYSIPYLFPRSVYDGFGLEKELTISDQIGEKARIEMGRVRKVGFGMSPLAESFSNFGYFGPVVFSFSMIIWIHMMAKFLYSRSPLIVVWICMLTPTLVTVNRVAFASLFNYIFMVSIIFYVVYIIGSAIDSLIPKKIRTS